MGKCSCHPEIETSYLCMKYNQYLCKECLRCQDPEIYCKFRSSCPIWFMQKKGIEDWAGADEEAPDEKRGDKVG